jgi:acyl-CoA synthetase (NDP forming)
VKIKKYIEKAMQEGRSLLTELESKEILLGYGINVEIGELVRSEEELEKISDKIEYPVVLKILSPQITHKSDVGGVKLNIDKPKLLETYSELIKSVKKKAPDAQIEGVLVQKMHQGYETIVGMYKDSQFGPIIMFGLGGIFVEILKDVSFRLPPLSKKEAMKMIKGIKGYPLLEGVRGKEGADINALAELISRFSKFVMENEEIKEVDLNPVIVNKDGAVVVDARIVI